MVFRQFREILQNTGFGATKILKVWQLKASTGFLSDDQLISTFRKAVN